MKILAVALLYTGLIVTANAGWPDMARAEGISDLREGDLRKLVVHSEAKPMPDIAFDGENGKLSLAEYRGQVVVLNFWALWCAPCREEMPALDELQAELGGDDFQVVTIATGRNAPEKIAEFFDETGVTNLPTLLDPKQQLSRQMGVVGLPVTVLIDRDGTEVARLLGDADWASDAAKDVIRQMTAD